MVKLGLLGDPHARPAPVAEALAIFQREQVDTIWCTGDIAGYGEQLDETISLLEESGSLCILGNHEIWYLEKHPDQADTSTSHYLQGLPLIHHEDIEGVRIYMVHASPPDSMSEGVRLLDQHGQVIEQVRQSWAELLADFEYDVLIIGHTHQVFAEQLGNTLVINPGSTRFNHCCAILTLPRMDIQWFALSGQSIIKSWNWGMVPAD